jgi:N utilization substance protein A
MKKELLLMVDVLSNEKGIERELIFQALELALASASREHYGHDWDIRVAIDRKTGAYETYRRWIVVDDEDENFESPLWQLLHARALMENAEAQVGDIIEKPLESVEFARIGAQRAKQVIYQKVREAERMRVVEAFQDRVGELISGVVKRREKAFVILDLGNGAEGIIPRDHLIPREQLEMGSRVRAYLFDVGSSSRGPQIQLSRTHPNLLLELFRLEVPEIAQGLIELKGAARDPGLRAKIAVQAKDKRIDPVGACVGIRGSRVQAVTTELAGERVDIVPWDENVAQFVINAMAPAEVESITVDEDAHSMTVAVSGINLAKAIGRSGQNVRLASELTGWKLDVLNAEELDARKQEEASKVVNLFTAELDIDQDIANLLFQAGFTSLEEIAYVPESELLSIEEFDEGIVGELRQRAEQAILNQAIAQASQQTEAFLVLPGMTESLLSELNAAGISDIEQLADLATDELLDLVKIDEKHAAQIIMAARGL